MVYWTSNSKVLFLIDNLDTLFYIEEGYGLFLLQLQTDLTRIKTI